VLILSDLDFTLLKSDMSLGEFTKSVWNELAKKEKLSIATARSLTGVKSLLKDLTLNEPLILLDGALIAKANGEIVEIFSIKKDMGDEILKLVREKFNESPLIVAIEESEEIFSYPSKLNRCQEKLLKKFHNKRRVFLQDKYGSFKDNLKMVYMGESDKINEIELFLKEKFNNKLELKSSDDPYIGCRFLTVLNPKGDKSHALKKLEEIEGVKVSQTMVFGDSHNDIGLFRVAGKKIAVANAIDELKKAADIVLPWSNDEEGVARYLKENFLDH